MNISSDDTPPITCKDSVRLVSQLRDNELDAVDVVRLERHVQSCPRCQTALQQFEHLHIGLDVLLAKSQTQPIERPAIQTVNNSRRRWLVWLSGVGAGGLAGGGAVFWLASTTLQTAQTTEDAIARRIAQYQALYLRETVQYGELSSAQQQAVLMQWLEQTPQISSIKAAPILTSLDLRLVRAQRLGFEKYAILQWVYLPKQGQPIALCGVANFEKTHTNSAPESFIDAEMRGTHWLQRDILWVLVAPKYSWSAHQLIQLQERIKLELA